MPDFERRRTVKQVRQSSVTCAQTQHRQVNTVVSEPHAMLALSVLEAVT